MDLFTTEQLTKIAEAETKLREAKDLVASIRTEVYESLTDADRDHMNLCLNNDFMGYEFGPQVAYEITHRMGHSIIDALGDCLSAVTYS